jgi:hypothetical protein
MVRPWQIQVKTGPSLLDGVMPVATLSSRTWRATEKLRKAKRKLRRG